MQLSPRHLTLTLILLVVLDRLLREQLLNLAARTQYREGRLHDAVEEESEVDQQREARNLQPLKGLPF